jgi:thymidylate kinase
MFYSVFKDMPKVDALLILKTSVDELTKRAKKRNDHRWDRYESDNEFIHNVILSYNKITDVHGSRMLDILNTNSTLPHPTCKYIDASGSIEEVFDRVKTVLGVPDK